MSGSIKVQLMYMKIKRKSKIMSHPYTKKSESNVFSPLLLPARPSMTETTALGAAMAAGAAEGIAIWDLTKLTPLTTDDFTPSIMPEGK